jgi:hypothetical protein
VGIPSDVFNIMSIMKSSHRHLTFFELLGMEAKRNAEIGSQVEVLASSSL